MPTASKVLGILKPIGGGDPVPLTKETLRIGRRPSCDICLDFEKISGKHCELRFFHGLWHIRDIGSTNGTTVNGLKYATEQSVLPDVEIGIGGHLYTIDYEPAGPSSVVEGSQILDDDVIETRTRKSLMELAGLEVEGPREVVSPLQAARDRSSGPRSTRPNSTGSIPKDLPDGQAPRRWSRPPTTTSST